VAAITKGTCVACHTIPGVPGAVGMVGPDLTNIGAEAGTRIPGTSAEEYIHQSIVDPNAFIAPKCPYGLSCNAGSMLPNLATLLSEDELKLIVDFLLTRQGGTQ
jgi:nitrite reductase (NO-forming)/hydroxylamine reductase